MTRVASDVRSANEIFSGALLEALVEAGVTHLCLCPGSRSTPLAAAAARTAGLVLHPHLDERACGFFGLGIARASRTPVALVCTSGTAAANFLPAIIEAFYSRAPLIALTADRPPELRAWGAGQTIDQPRLFGSHVRLFAEAPTPGPELALAPYARMLATRAVATALGRPAGPVHLNLPFREPLEPTPGVAACLPVAVSGSGASVHCDVQTADRTPPASTVSRLAARMAGTPCGVLVAGPTDRDAALAPGASRLARQLGWPLLAEPISQLRCGPHASRTPVIAHYDAFLRDARFAREHVPRLVICLGDTPTSKPLRRWLEADPETAFVRVDPDAAWNDPAHRGGDVLQMDAARLCDALCEALPDEPTGATKPWMEAFLAADRACARAFDEALASEPRLLTPSLVRTVADSLPAEACVFVSNSMAVRDVDGFWPASERRIRFLCNRGANGIDGIVSTALGASCAVRGPTVLLTGDLAFLHDVGGLFAARRHEPSCTIVVANDDGGGIFSLLPIADQGESVRFSALFTLEHGLSVAPAAALYGLESVRAASVHELRRALVASIGRPGVRIIEVPIERQANLAHHRALWSAAATLAAGRGRS